mmetsp:Transcript_29141/g.21682  ORF Transcript_29141/g.21682 Transcript_29141/m.21682 type:complete len:152 (+) Transcript_29141:12-467(+)
MGKISQCLMALYLASETLASDYVVVVEPLDNWRYHEYPCFIYSEDSQSFVSGREGGEVNEGSYAVSFDSFHTNLFGTYTKITVTLTETYEYFFCTQYFSKNVEIDVDDSMLDDPYGYVIVYEGDASIEIGYFSYTGYDCEGRTVFDDTYDN